MCALMIKLTEVTASETGSGLRAYTKREFWVAVAEIAYMRRPTRESLRVQPGSELAKEKTTWVDVGALVRIRHGVGVGLMYVVETPEQIMEMMK